MVRERYLYSINSVLMFVCGFCKPCVSKNQEHVFSRNVCSTTDGVKVVTSCIACTHSCQYDISDCSLVWCDVSIRLSSSLISIGTWIARKLAKPLCPQALPSTNRICSKECCEERRMWMIMWLVRQHRLLDHDLRNVCISPRQRCRWILPEG